MISKLISILQLSFYHVVRFRCFKDGADGSVGIVALILGLIKKLHRWMVTYIAWLVFQLLFTHGIVVCKIVCIGFAVQEPCSGCKIDRAAGKQARAHPRPCLPVAHS
jgi:hypothetical protein